VLIDLEFLDLKDNMRRCIIAREVSLSSTT
jgi:hypothetical protein